MHLHDANDARPLSAQCESSDDAWLVEAATRIFMDGLPRRLAADETARRLGLSPGDLAAAFQRQGLNMRAHVRAERLSALNQYLEAGAEHRIERALVRWGFSPHNQEAIQDYRRLFGETPGETLARHAGVATAGVQPGIRRAR